MTKEFMTKFRSLAGRDPDKGDVLELAKRMELNRLERERKRTEVLERERYDQALATLESEYFTRGTELTDLALLERYEQEDLDSEMERYLMEQKRAEFRQRIRGKTKLALFWGVWGFLRAVSPPILKFVCMMGAIVGVLIFNGWVASTIDGEANTGKLGDRLCTGVLLLTLIEIIILIVGSAAWAEVMMYRNRYLDRVKRNAAKDLGVELDKVDK